MFYSLRMKDLTPDPNKVTYIYALLDDQGRVRYVGKSDMPLRRYISHRHRALTLNLDDHKSNWIRSMESQGRRPVLFVLECCDHRIWEEREVMWIDLFGKYFDLTNHRDGGGRGRFDEKARAKMRAAKLGKPTWNKGKTTPPEIREKQSVSAKRRWRLRQDKEETVSRWAAGGQRLNRRNAKLTPEQVREIRHILAESKRSYESIGREFGVNGRVISFIKSGEHYAWVE